MGPKSTRIHPCILFSLFLACSLPLKGLTQTPPGKDPVAFEMSNRNANTQIMPAGINKSWFNEAVAKIEEREYFIQATDRAGTFAAVNHAQHLGYLFTEKGYTVNNFNDDGSDKGVWRTNFTLEGIGRKDRLHTSPLRHASTTEDYSLQFDHKDYVVTYDNRRPGMEQSFIVKHRPAGHSELQIVLGLQGDLQATMGKGDQLLLYKAGHPQDVKLAYDNFKVWDANGKPLHAHMHLTPEHRVVMTVDDRHAVYPLTVDPFTHPADVTINLSGVLGNAGFNDPATPVLAGYSICSVKDVDNNLADEIVIGAPRFAVIGTITGGIATISGSATGAAFVFLGVHNGTPSTTPSRVLQPAGLAAGALFGFSVASADMDNDGKGDIIVGAPSDLSKVVGFTSSRSGNVYVFNGSSLGSSLDTKPTEVAMLSLDASALSALSVAPLYGFSVANAGLINNDAFEDIIVGSPNYINLTAGGRVDIFHGNGTAALTGTTPSKTITGNANTMFGWSVSGAGKINNDTYSDVVVGAPGAAITPSGAAGRAYVFYSSNSGSGITANTTSDAAGAVGTTLSAPGNPLSTTLFGYSVASGNFNGDGFSDILVGEPLAADHNGAAGRVNIYYSAGAASGVGGVTPQSLISPRRGLTGPNLLFGYSVAAGNVSGDGTDDIIVGEPGNKVISGPAVQGALSIVGLSSTTAVANGAVYVYRGVNPGGVLTGAAPYWTYNNTTGVSVDLVGTSVSAAGDINGDGFNDLLIGAPSGTLDLSYNLPTNLDISAPLTVGAGLFNDGNLASTYLFFGNTSSLPLTLLSFTATANDGDAILSWSTAQEVNTSHFEIERSAGGINFSSIGQVSAKNDNTLTTNYTYTDGSPASGDNYYRLRMVDIDGKFTYSKVVSLDFQPNGPSVISTYPNPAHGSFNLLFRNMAPGTYRMNLASVLGQSVLSKNIQVSNAIRHNETINLPALAPGSYWVRLIDQQNHSFLSRVEIR